MTNYPRHAHQTARNKTSSVVMILGVALLCAAVPARAADYPLKPVRFLVGFAAGGGIDTSCRYWAQKLSARAGQPVVVENRPGAAAELATRMTIGAAPDGYTLQCISAGTTVSSARPNPPFDVRRDVAAIVQMTQFPFALYVNPDLPVKTVAEFIAYAKARPGQLNYSSVGIGSINNLVVELFKQTMGIELVHVAYKGSAQSAQAVMTNEVQTAMDTPSVLKPLFDAGRLRPLAVTSTKRYEALPNVVGMQEAGISTFKFTTWSGLAGPAKTPRSIVDYVNAEMNAVLKEAETRDLFFKLGYETAGGTPEDFARLLDSEVATWGRVIREARIHFD